MKKKIAVFTGNRAEYGLLYSTIKELQEHPEVDLLLFVSGAHLDPLFGNTIDSIKEAGFPISEIIKISLVNDDLFSTSLAIGDGIQAIAKVLKEHSPDMLVVYADRFEGFAAVIAASQMRIPVAHIEGGDITEGGALDDSVRHAMTKLAHLHFTTNEQAFRNVVSMGEEAWRVVNVGLPSLDGIVNGQYAKEAELVRQYSVDATVPIVVFTQHAVSPQIEKTSKEIGNSLTALEKLLNEGVKVFLTYPNNDAGGKLIIKIIEEFKDRNKKFSNLHVIPSLGAFKYHGILALAQNPHYRIVCVGNSSSGIKETPVFGCPTVNIGNRQDGRLRAENVIDVGYDADEIYAAIRKCIFDPTFRNICRNAQNPYGKGGSGKMIVEHLVKVEIGPNLIAKKSTFA